MDRERLKNVLQSVDFLAAASPEGIERLLRCSELVRLAKGETLFLEGDVASRFFVVIEGWIRVYKGHPEGDRQLVLHLEGPGSPLAEVAIFLDEERYPASAEAVVESQVLAIPKKGFLKLLEDEPHVARVALKYLARRQRALINLVTKMTFQDVLERLVGYLVERLEAEGQGFELPTNAELAALLGTVPEIISRKLWKLYREGLIELENRKVQVTEPAYLLAKFMPRRR